jgi:DNA-binding transcriptional LysR family regulator
MSMTDIESISVRQLRYFIAVAEELNLSRAARRLNLSQPPLTRQMHQLEQAVGTPLLTRSPRGVQLTQAGEVLLADARNVVLMLRQTAERARSAGEGQVGHIDVAVFGSLMLDAVPALLARFRAAHPRVEVVLQTMNRWDQIEALRQNRIGVGFSRRGTDPHGIAREVFKSERLMVALGLRDPLASRKRLALRELADRPFVMQASGPRPNRLDAVVKLCAGAGFQPKIEQTVGDAVTAVALVAAGFGLSLVPGSVTHLKLPGVAYVPLSTPSEGIADLDCIYRQGDDSPVLQAFLRELRAFRRLL